MTKENEDHAALLPVDPSASQSETETLPNEQIQLLAWATVNCHVLARRALARTTSVYDREKWEHVLRICEKAGARSQGVLRASLPTELTDGSGSVSASEPGRERAETRTETETISVGDCCAGLIGQPIPDMEGTEPRLSLSDDQRFALGLNTRRETVERLRSIHDNTDAWPHLLASQQWAILDAIDALSSVCDGAGAASTTARLRAALAEFRARKPEPTLTSYGAHAVNRLIEAIEEVIG